MPQPLPDGSRPAAPVSSVFERAAVAVLLLSFAILYWAEALHLGARQHLQTDDVFTLWMIKSPSIVAGLKVGADTAPPAFYWLMKASCELFGYTDLGLRLPTMLATFLFVAAIFLLLRRHVGDALAGAAAIAPLFGSAAAAELFARPPALMMASFALLCLLWEHDRTARPRLWRSIAIAAVLGFAISMHFYSVLFVPIAALLELVWTSENRTLRMGHWIGIAAGASVLLLWLPVIGPIYRMTHTSAGSPSYYAHPTPLHLLEYIGNIGFSSTLIFLMLVVLVMGSAWRWWQIYRGQRSLPLLREFAPDNLGAVGFAAGMFPLLTYAFTLVVTHVFNERYIVSAALGIAIALALLVRSLRWPRGLELLLLLVVVAIYDKAALTIARRPVNPLAQFESVIQQVPGSEPVALPDGGSFFAAEQSASSTVRARAAYVFLPAGMSDDDTEPSRLAHAWNTLRPELPIYDNQTFLAGHRSFYILSWGKAGEDLVPWAIANLRTQIVAVRGDITVYHVTQP